MCLKVYKKYVNFINQPLIFVCQQHQEVEASQNQHYGPHHLLDQMDTMTQKSHLLQYKTN